MFVIYDSMIDNIHHIEKKNMIIIIIKFNISKTEGVKMFISKFSS